jgi:hypothetical protein
MGAGLSRLAPDLAFPMPTKKPFFPNLRPMKKVVTPTGDVLVRKTCKRGNEFMGQTRYQKCLEKKVKAK